MAVTTGSGGLSGAGGWGALGAGAAEGAAQASRQSAAQAATAGVQSGAQSGVQSAQVGGLLSAAELTQTARAALAQAQVQQADVMLTLSKGAQSLLEGSALLGQAGGAGAGVSSTTTGDAVRSAAGGDGQSGLHAASSLLEDSAVQRSAQGTAQNVGATGDDVRALMADIMEAADAVLNDPSATNAQKTMATGLMQLARSMAGQSASAGGSGAMGAGSLSLLQSSGLLQVSDSQSAAAAAGGLGGAVVTTSGLYGLASATVHDGARAMATALLGMGGALEDDIVLPGGIVQFSASAAQATGSAGADASMSQALLGNALTSALLPQLFKALSAVLTAQNATAEQKAAATTLLQMFDTVEDAGQIPQILLDPLLAAALMPALTPSQRGKLVRAALAGEVEDMGRLEEADLSGQVGIGGLQAALRRNAAYLASVQKPLLSLALQTAQNLDAEQAVLAGWATMARREAGMEDALADSSVLAFSQNLMADSPYMGAMASTSLTPILIMSWAALMSGCLPRAYPFVPRVWRRADKKKWRRKKRGKKMNFQNLMFSGGAVEV